MQDLIASRNNWKKFFDNFSRRNRSRLVSIEVFGEMGAQRQVKKMPLSGIVFESRSNDSLSLEIMLENRRAGEASHFTHFIPNVRNVCPKQSPGGRDEALEVEGADGSKILLKFEQLPELTAGALYAVAAADGGGDFTARRDRLW